MITIKTSAPTPEARQRLDLLTIRRPGNARWKSSAENLMADIAQRVPENVAGRYYVDETCIDCDLCREYAPRSFVRLDDAGYSYVYNQPVTADEEKACRSAMEECPVEAIGIEPEG